jgi:polyferredoxin
LNNEKPPESGVTRSSRLIPPITAAVLCGAILTAAHLAAPRPLLLAARVRPHYGWIQIAALAGYAALLAVLLRRSRNVGRLRSIYWRGFSFVFFCQFLLGLLVTPFFLMSGTLHLPVPALILSGPLYRGGGVFMILLLLGAVAVVGPGWCSHLCYIGAWDDGASKTRRSAATDKPLSPSIRYGILGAALLLPILFRYAGIGNAAATLTAAGFGAAGVGVMIFFSTRRGQMVHCTAYCPVGALVALLGRAVPFRLRVDRHVCNDCGLCAEVCRYGAAHREARSSGRAGWNCTLCGDCLPTCPRGALSVVYGFAGRHDASGRDGRSRAKRHPNAWGVYAALAAGLHAVFLGLARL